MRIFFLPIEFAAARIASLLAGRARRNLPTLSRFRCGPACALYVTGLAGVAVSLIVAPGLKGVFGSGLAVTMTAIASIDARYFFIPDKLVLVAIGLGLAHAALAPADASIAVAVGAAALRGAGIALAFWALLKAYQWIRGREGMGLGDVKLAGVAGLWLDWPATVIAIEIAALAALAVVALRIYRGHRITARTALPFGAFLAPAIWLGWVAQESILQGLW